MNTAPIDVVTTPESTASDWLSAHGDYLFNFAVGQVRDAGVAEDIVQDTFLAALKSHDRFRGKSSERTWLTGILRHKIYDHLRRVCRERPLRHEPSPSRNDEACADLLLWLHDVSAECIAPGWSWLSSAKRWRKPSANCPRVSRKYSSFTKLKNNRIRRCASN